MITRQTVFHARQRLAILALLIAVSPAGMPALPGRAADTNFVIPLIVMEDVPLTDAIKNLARQAGINYILDPRVAGFVSRREGSFGKAKAGGRPGPR